MNFLMSDLKLLLRNVDVALALTTSAREHRRIETDFRQRLRDICPAVEGIEFPHLGLPAAQYWQRNFFSILFLSIFDALGMPARKRRTYGLVLHAVRGIVTAADNILDNECKGAVRLDLNGGVVLPNFVLTLLQQSMLDEIIADAAPDETARRRASAALTGALFEIAREESQEEEDIETVLSPEELLDNIHSFRGGRLLQLAFVVPEITEPEFAGGIRRARAAIHRIGLALQVLDDLTDFGEDITRRNHNILRSWVVHRAPDGPTTVQSLLDIAEDDLAAPETIFPRATRDVLSLAIEMALEGFGRLHDLGHVIDRAAALDLIGMMFRLSGLPHLWKLYDGNIEVHASLIEQRNEAW
jgi:hypothetical protein